MILRSVGLLLMLIKMKLRWQRADMSKSIVTGTRFELFNSMISSMNGATASALMSEESVEELGIQAVTNLKNQEPLVMLYLLSNIYQNTYFSPRVVSESPK